MTASQFYDSGVFARDIDYSEPPEVPKLQHAEPLGESVWMTAHTIAAAVAMTGALLFGPSIKGATASEGARVVYEYVHGVEHAARAGPTDIEQAPLSEAARAHAKQMMRMLVPAPLSAAEKRDDPDHDL
jgi:hypothetical protein